MADKTKREIVENMRNSAKIFRAVLDLADMVDDVDKLEREANTALKTVNDLTTQGEELSNAVSSLTEQKTALEEDIAEKVAKSQGIVDTANMNAKRIFDDADSQAKTIIAKAKEDAAQYVATVKASVQDLSDKASNAQEELDTLNERVEARQADLSEIEAKVEAAKQSAISTINKL